MKTGFLEKVLGGNGVYVIAEMSCNHQQDMHRAEQIVQAAKEAGADAIKVQTFTPDTITLDSANPDFTIKGTIWEGRKLHDLYRGAYMPWDWHFHLKEIAVGLDMDFFSSPFDVTAVDFLEKVGVPVYKVASFEVVDIPLLEKIASTGRPVIMSTGMATLAEIDEAVTVLRDNGCPGLVLLKCTSAYPAPFEEMNLRTIPHMSEAFRVPVGLSDHTLGIEVPVAAVALGARIVEKHLTLSRADGGPDSAFSLEPLEFKAMVEAVRHTEKALGGVRYGVTGQQMAGKALRRSLYVVQDMKRGELFTHENVRSIRPGAGLHTRYLARVIGKRASRDISRGTAMAWELVNFGA